MTGRSTRTTTNSFPGQKRFKSDPQNSKLRPFYSELRARNPNLRVPSTNVGAQSTEFRVLNTNFLVPSTNFRALSMKFLVPSAEFRPLSTNFPPFYLNFRALSGNFRLSCLKTGQGNVGNCWIYRPASRIPQGICFKFVTSSARPTRRTAVGTNSWEKR
jgi:hypothetical protein